MGATSSRIDGLLRENHMTRRQLSEVIGLSAPSVSGKMNGKIAWTTADLVHLSQYFNVSIDFLLGRSDRDEVLA